MAFRKITAIIQTDRLEATETALEAAGVKGISVMSVKGYGAYGDFFATPPVVRHARIELFVKANEVDSIVNAIMQAAHTGTAGDGIVAVLPVERLYNIWDRSEVTADERQAGK